MNDNFPKSIDELMDMWKNDAPVDMLELGEAALNTGKLHSKYVAIMSKHRLIAKKKWIDYKERREIHRRYYRGDFNNNSGDLEHHGFTEPWRGPHVSIEIQSLLDMDKKLNQMLLEKEYHEEFVAFCESVLKELNSRTYAIGNSIRWNIFMGGG